MNNEISTIKRQLKTLTLAVGQMLEALGLTPSHGDASVSEPTNTSPMAVRAAFVEDEDDPNTVKVHITDGYVRNRMTLPREIYIKSKRDSYDHSVREVDDPKHSFVVVDGVKYFQTGNQGRSNKLQISTFGAKAEGQTITFSRIKGNQWESSVSGKAARNGNVPSAKASKAVSKSISIPATKGKKTATAGSSKSTGRVANPFAPKAQAKSTGKAAASRDWDSVLSISAQHVKANAKAGFYNENVVNLHDRDYRVYLKREQHKAFKTAAKAEGLSLRKAVDILAKTVEK